MIPRMVFLLMGMTVLWLLSGSQAVAQPVGIHPSQQGKISVNFRDTPLRMVLKVFSLESGLNFVYSPEVAETKVTAQLSDISWDRALVGILASSNLSLKTIGTNLAQIHRAGQRQVADGRGAMAQNVSRTSTPMVVGRGGQSVFTVNLTHGSAVYLEPRLNKVFKDQDVTVVVDEKANGLLIRCPARRKAAVLRLIAALDRKPVQVEIASRIVEISTTQSKFAGVLLGNRLNFDPGRGLGFGALNFPNAIFSNFTVDPGVSATNAAGNFNFKFASLNKAFDLDLLLKLEERRGNSKILQSSNLLVTNNEPARIESGLSDFFFGFSSNPAVLGEAGNDPLGDGTTSLTEVRYNLALEVTPEVTANGEVLLNLTIVSDIPQASQFPRAVAGKSRRKIQTQMIRASGETAVIGGIYDKKLITNSTRIPLLSDIPIIGPLFRSTSRSITKTELVILVTPKVIYPKGPGQGPLTLQQNSPAALRTASQQRATRRKASQALPPIEARPQPEQNIAEQDLPPALEGEVAPLPATRSRRAPNGELGSGLNQELEQELDQEPDRNLLGEGQGVFDDGPKVVRERALPPIEAVPVPEAAPDAQQNIRPLPNGLPQKPPVAALAPKPPVAALPQPNGALNQQEELPRQRKLRANGLPAIEAQPQPESGPDEPDLVPPPIPEAAP